MDIFIEIDGNRDHLISREEMAFRLLLHANSVAVVLSVERNVLCFTELWWLL